MTCEELRPDYTAYALGIAERSGARRRSRASRPSVSGLRARSGERPGDG